LEAGESTPVSAAIPGPKGSRRAFTTDDARIKLDLCTAPESAELKMLLRAPRGGVIVSTSIDKNVLRPKSLAQGFGVTPRHRQSTALLGAIKREGADDDVTAAPQRAMKAGNIGGLVGRSGQEVKRRSVVPNIIRPRRLLCRHVGGEPMDLLRLVADAHSSAAPINQALSNRCSLRKRDDRRGGKRHRRYQ